ncbi:MULTISPECIES: type III polyketide synthase [unclassified Sphingomonas]|uniref:type III polyketide synthase n=1 Tax=unclassified Sphingomonas TaxID=196159 RepID=UPI000E10C222|nr:MULTISPECIES: type III polyketide synthase [unclassified Sphingomonas]AXJ96887.1 type III polyketide synthase [Sphingomonas sp. FARSPH]
MALSAYLHAVGTATPPHDIHAAFASWAATRLAPRDRPLFARMAARAGIAHRWSVLADPVGPDGFYAGPMPGTGTRMQVYAEHAPTLALAAIAALHRRADCAGITHLVVASCTGFVAPGIDQLLAAALGLSPEVERTLIGFMGCYAAVAALRTARHIVRSEHAARVLVVTVELSTLHLQDIAEVAPLLAMLQFGDGAAAALVTGEPGGIMLGQPFATTLADSADLIRWTITDQGFAMHLDGAVPGRIGQALADPALVARITQGAVPADLFWAVHAGGRSILDAVEQALGLSPDALAASRRVLAERGNMSSTTLMAVLEAMLADPPAQDRGVALAFGPGLAAEGLALERVG